MHSRRRIVRTTHVRIEMRIHIYTYTHTPARTHARTHTRPHARTRMRRNRVVYWQGAAHSHVPKAQDGHLLLSTSAEFHPIRAAPLVRAKVKITVKNAVCPSLPFAAYGVFECEFGFTRTSGDGLRTGVSAPPSNEAERLFDSILDPDSMDIRRHRHSPTLV